MNYSNKFRNNDTNFRIYVFLKNYLKVCPSQWTRSKKGLIVSVFLSINSLKFNRNPKKYLFFSEWFETCYFIYRQTNLTRLDNVYITKYICKSNGETFLVYAMFTGWGKNVGSQIALHLLDKRDWCLPRLISLNNSSSKMFNF